MTVFVGHGRLRIGRVGPSEITRGRSSDREDRRDRDLEEVALDRLRPAVEADR